jgi:SAM-dependent methyltransferase
LVRGKFLMTDFEKTLWVDQHRTSASGRVKQSIYFFMRPVLSWYHTRSLSSRILNDSKPDLVIGPRGLPLETRRRWATAHVRLAEATILVQGTGTGWDVISWAALRPQRIIATDLYAFEESWNAVAEHCKTRFGVDVEFRQAPLEDHSFLPNDSVDLCGSDAVFEHCRDLGSVLRETHRLLKPGGTLYSAHGPLWFGASGDHFSGRGGIQHVFNHVLLEPDAYQQYFKSQIEAVENFQSGGRYVELDLFSKLTTAEYLAKFGEAGFRVDSLILEVSPDSLAFKRQFPDRFAELVRRWSGRCTPDDFLIKGNIVRLTKVAR